MNTALLLIGLAFVGAAAAAGTWAGVVSYRRRQRRFRRLQPTLDVTLSQFDSESSDRYVRLELVNRAGIGLVVTSLRATQPASARFVMPEGRSDPISEVPLQVEIPAASLGIWGVRPRKTFSFWLRDAGASPRLHMSYCWRDGKAHTEDIEVNLNRAPVQTMP